MATDTNPRARMVRFATFDVDLNARELRKGSVKIKVHGQPFEVLAMLLDQPGEVVPPASGELTSAPIFHLCPRIQSNGSKRTITALACDYPLIRSQGRLHSILVSDTNRIYREDRYS